MSFHYLRPLILEKGKGQLLEINEGKKHENMIQYLRTPRNQKKTDHLLSSSLIGRKKKQGPRAAWWQNYKHTALGEKMGFASDELRRQMMQFFFFTDKSESIFVVICTSSISLQVICLATYSFHKKEIYFGNSLVDSWK